MAIADVGPLHAYRLWTEGTFKELKAHLKSLSKDSNRYTEARYYEGLALYHLGQEEKATKLWESTINACSEDPWIYRADWAYCNAKQKGRRMRFSSAGPRTSCLNRIGYMGPKNPDLKPR